MGNSCCYKSTFDVEMEVEDFSDFIKIEEVYIKPTDVSLSGDYWFNGITEEAVVSSDSSVISL